MKRTPMQWLQLGMLGLFLTTIPAVVLMLERAEADAVPDWEQNLTESEREALAHWRSLGDPTWQASWF